MIAISGYGEEDDKRAAREAGFDAYLTKPVRVDEVVALLS
jgi:CheY-like chemotaxis protein